MDSARDRDAGTDAARGRDAGTDAGRDRDADVARGGDPWRDEDAGPGRDVDAEAATGGEDAWGSREPGEPGDEGAIRRIGAPPGGRPARAAVLAGLGPPRQRGGQRGGRGRHHREDPRPPRRRGGRGLLTPLLAVLVLVIATGLGVLVVNWLNSPAATGVRLAAGDGAPADGVFLAHPGAAGSGSSQVLSAVASVGSTVVAVGGDTTSPLPRPLFLVSTDGGSSWELGRVSGPAAYEARLGTPGMVTGGDGRWLAAGSGAAAGAAEFGFAGGAASARGIWTSADGRTWNAVDPARLSMFWPGDRIADVARTAYGFVAVGSTTLSDGRTGPAAWVSQDGQSWTRIDSREIGSPDDVRGIRAAVAKGDQVVALADPGQGDASSVILRSPDGGRRWQRAAEPLAQVRPEPGALAVAKEGFVLVPTRQSASGGKVTVYCSADGASWRGCGSIGPLGADSTGVRGLAYSAAGVAAVAETSWQTYTVFTSENGTDWAKSAELGTIPGILRGLAITDQGMLVAGGDERAGDVDNLPILMTARQGEQARAVPLGEVTGLSRSARETTRVAAANGLFVAVGAAQGDAGIWTSADGTGWKTIGGEALGGAGRQALADVAHGPRGWLAVGGTMSDPVVTAPLLVTSRDGEQWRRVEATDALAVPQGRHYLAPASVAAGPKGYVIAGAERSGDGVTAALWYTDDLRRYQRIGKLPAGGSGVRLHDVAATSAGYVAVGASGAAERETGVVWVSEDGRTWTARPRVVPEGASSATLRRVVATPSGLVAVGAAATGEGRRPFAAVSADHGRTWTYSWLPAEGAATALDLTAAGSVLIAVGSHGSSSGGDAVAWISEDGRHWNRQSLEETGLAGEGAQWLGTVAVLGDRVVALGRSTTYTSDHLTLWRTTLNR